MNVLQRFRFVVNHRLSWLFLKKLTDGFYFTYRTHGISNTVTNIMSEIFTGVSNRAVLQIGWCFKYKSCRGE